jgi:hypothetical protein
VALAALAAPVRRADRRMAAFGGISRSGKMIFSSLLMREMDPPESEIISQ